MFFVLKEFCHYADWGDETTQWLYALEADAFARALADGKTSVPEVPIEDTLDNMLTLDRWRSAFGLLYGSEKPSSQP